jgi:hypothetical protein
MRFTQNKQSDSEVGLVIVTADPRMELGDFEDAAHRKQDKPRKVVLCGLGPLRWRWLYRGERGVLKGLIFAAAEHGNGVATLWTDRHAAHWFYVPDDDLTAFGKRVDTPRDGQKSHHIAGTSPALVPQRVIIVTIAE